MKKLGLWLPRGHSTSIATVGPGGLSAGAGNVFFLRHDGTDPVSAGQDVLKINTWNGGTYTNPYDADKPRTFEAWVRLPALPATFADNAPIFSCGAKSSNADYSLQVEDDSDMLLNHWFNDVTLTTFWTGNVNAWKHLAVAYDGAGTEHVYLNGSEVGTGYSVTSLATTRTDLGIFGRTTLDFGRLQCDIFDIRIWNDLRTGAEIAANMNAFVSPAAAGLEINVKLQDGAGTAPAVVGPAASAEGVTAAIDNTNSRITWEISADPRA